MKSNKKIKLSSEDLKKIILHFVFIFLISVIILVIFFYVFLPIYTKHTNVLIVPDLKGMPAKNLKKYLNDKGLRYKVKNENAYSSKYDPNVVLSQDPVAGSKVKSHRTVYVTLNADSPPIIKMPNLLHCSVRGASMVLKSHGLQMGHVKYVLDIAENAVLKQLYKGKIINKGDYIAKGSKIDLIIGSGLGKELTQVPNVFGKKQNEAEKIIKKAGFQIGNIIFEMNDHIEPDTVFRQVPTSDFKSRLGSIIDIWVSQSIKSNTVNTVDNNNVTDNKQS